MGRRGELTGLVLSGSRCCRAEPPGLACNCHGDSELIPHTLVATGSSFCLFSENGASGETLTAPGLSCALSHWHADGTCIPPHTVLYSCSLGTEEPVKLQVQVGCLVFQWFEMPPHSLFALSLVVSLWGGGGAGVIILVYRGGNTSEQIGIQG